MELKTLKDFREVHVAGYGYIKGTADKIELKAEAIKWVKHIETGEEVDCGKVRFKWDKRSQWTGPSGQVLTEWIKHFFNITEEDLK